MLSVSFYGFLPVHNPVLETQCPVRYAKHRKSFLNGPSLETSRVKKEWLQIGKELLESYPNGIKCSCGKADFDFGNTNMIAKHLIFNPKHTLKVKGLPHVGTKMKDSQNRTIGTTQIILLGHMMACWKGKSLNYIGKLVSDLF